MLLGVVAHRQVLSRAGGCSDARCQRQSIQLVTVVIALDGLLDLSRHSHGAPIWGHVGLLLRTTLSAVAAALLASAAALPWKRFAGSLLVAMLPRLFLLRSECVAWHRQLNATVCAPMPRGSAEAGGVAAAAVDGAAANHSLGMGPADAGAQGRAGAPSLCELELLAVLAAIALSFGAYAALRQLMPTSEPT